MYGTLHFEKSDSLAWYVKVPHAESKPDSDEGGGFRKHIRHMTYTRHSMTEQDIVQGSRRYLRQLRRDWLVIDSSFPRLDWLVTDASFLYDPPPSLPSPNSPHNPPITPVRRCPKTST